MTRSRKHETSRESDANSSIRSSSDGNVSSKSSQSTNSIRLSTTEENSNKESVFVIDPCDVNIIFFETKFRIIYIFCWSH